MGKLTRVLLATGLCFLAPAAVVPLTAQSPPPASTQVPSPPVLATVTLPLDGDIADLLAVSGSKLLAEIPHLGQHLVQPPPGMDEGTLKNLATGAGASAFEPVLPVFASGSQPESEVDPPQYIADALNQVYADQALSMSPGTEVVMALVTGGLGGDLSSLQIHQAAFDYVVGLAGVHARVDDEGAIMTRYVVEVMLAVYPHLVILPKSILDSDGWGLSFYAAKAIAEAADDGADVIYLGFEMESDSLAIEAAIQYAQERGALLVAPAGNSFGGAVAFPASDPRVTSVAALDENDELAPFTALGADLSAPGVRLVAFEAFGVPVPCSGTGAAAAMVAGAMALARSVEPGAADQIPQALVDGARDVDAANLGLPEGSAGAGCLDVMGTVLQLLP